MMIALLCVEPRARAMPWWPQNVFSANCAACLARLVSSELAVPLKRRDMVVDPRCPLKDRSKPRGIQSLQSVFIGFGVRVRG
eukprot:2420610-Pyramimonas_sp.AAC.1